MKCNDSFNPIKELMDDPTTGNALNSIPIISMPANMPQDIQTAVFSKIAEQITTEIREPLKVSPLICSIESTQKALAFYNDLSILYWRGPDAKLVYNITAVPSGWIDYRG